MPQGKVKWFNNAKGYGFVIEDGGSEDLFVHFSSIQMEGYKTLKAGQSVFFDKQPSDKGTHAVNIRSVEAEESAQTEMVDDEIISVEDPVSAQAPAETTTSSTEEKVVHTPGNVVAF